MQQLIQLAKACLLVSLVCVQWPAVTAVACTPFRVLGTFRTCYYLCRCLASGEGIVTLRVTLSHCECVCVH